ncbi:MAG: CoA-binding protein [Acidobacteriota bacterium]
MRVVAVVGASADRRKFGNKAVRAFREAGYTVVPITPRYAEVEGLKAYASVREVPGPIDMATVYVPPEVGVAIMDDLAAKGVGEVWLNPGADEPEVVERARALGLRPIQACSIVGIGLTPGQF